MKIPIKTNEETTLYAPCTAVTFLTNVSSGHGTVVATGVWVEGIEEIASPRSLRSPA